MTLTASVRLSVVGFNLLYDFKKVGASKSQLNVYLPIRESLTSQMCKLFETIMRDALVHYLENNHLILDSQHGFRNGRYCLTNLLEFLDRVTGCVDAGDSVDVIFLDFAKAFDKVPHRRLVSKLKAHGIQGKILDWTGYRSGYGAEFRECVYTRCKVELD